MGFSLVKQTTAKQITPLVHLHHDQMLTWRFPQWKKEEASEHEQLSWHHPSTLSHKQHLTKITSFLGPVFKPLLLQMLCWFLGCNQHIAHHQLWTYSTSPLHNTRTSVLDMESFQRNQHVNVASSWKRKRGTVMWLLAVVASGKHTTRWKKKASRCFGCIKSWL